MQPHVKIYMDYFGYGMDDIIPCEVCNSKAVDIHHINGRGKGKNVIGNLMALCREHHTMCHDCMITKEQTQELHDLIIKLKNINI